jgi:arylsulfatase
LSLFKLTVGEGGIRAPLLIGGPGVKGGRQVDSLTYVWDVMPTLLEIAGIQHPDTYKGRKIEPMRGKSLQAMLAGTANSIRGEEDFIVGEMGDVGRWIRQGDFKAVWNAPPYGDEQWRLFNIVEDPGETRDLAKTMPEKVKVLREAGETYVEGVDVISAK